jgi:hypothetical protein
MGTLAKIEHNKTASAAFTGCAPIDWIAQKAADFAGWIGKGVFDIAKNFLGEMGAFFKGVGETIGDAWNWLKGIPGVKETAAFVSGAGAFMINGFKEGAKCIVTLVEGVAIAGAVALIGGGIYLAITGGALATIIGALTLGTFARFCIRGFVQAWQFNWNITAAEIANRNKAAVNAIASQAGGVVGSGLAALACGGGGAALVLKINPKAIALCEEVLEEAFDEWKGNATALLRSIAAGGKQWFMLEFFRNARSAIKKTAKNPSMRKLLPPAMAKTIDYWGSEKSKPWSFASAVEDAIESINPEWLRNFVEEAREEFADVCSEAAYALSYGL